MEAEKSYDLLSRTGDPGKLAMQFKPESWEANGVDFIPG
jgi:hypothetical protein